MSIELKLARSNRIYCPNEPIDGKIITKFPSSISHQGIRLTATGTVNPGSSKTFDIRSSGRIGSGTSEIPFSVTLRPQGQMVLKYYMRPSMEQTSAYLVRGCLHKSLSTTMEFIVESDKVNLLQAPDSPEMVNFYITRDTQRHPLLPELSSGEFRVTGKICTQSSLLDPINGEVTVESSTVPINSIDIHLLRIESILVGEKLVTETSVIQTTQIADGDVCRGMTLPIYVILPRLLTCPTIFAGPFSIEFQFSVVISFQSELSKLQPKADSRTPRLWVRTSW
ncbi:hypothetical protein MKX01_020556, partial [Papaver californicum]